jgi:hypothetical protein
MTGMGVVHPKPLSSRPERDEAHSLAPLLRGQLAEQRRLWHAGERPLVEVYFRQFSAATADSEAVLDLMNQEFLCREVEGESPTVEEYQQRFPTLASQIKAQIELDRGLRESRRSAEFRGGPIG